MEVAASIKKLGLEKAFQYLYKDPEPKQYREKKFVIGKREHRPEELSVCCL